LPAASDTPLSAAALLPDARGDMRWNVLFGLSHPRPVIQSNLCVALAEK
jgi:hypothetical protein